MSWANWHDRYLSLLPGRALRTPMRRAESVGRRGSRPGIGCGGPRAADVGRAEAVNGGWLWSLPAGKAGKAGRAAPVAGARVRGLAACRRPLTTPGWSARICPSDRGYGTQFMIKKIVVD